MPTLCTTRSIVCVVAGVAGVVLGAGAWMTAGPGADPLSGLAQERATMTETADRPVYSKSGYDITPLTRERVLELADERLTPEQRKVILHDGTEPAFCGTLLDNKKTGTYTCALCDLPLFSSADKFDSGSGWPSFFSPFDVSHVGAEEDNTLGMRRVEITCGRCGGHLGHVFDDGPAPTGLRFCVNSESLAFFEEGETLPAGATPIETAEAFFGGGCFWGIEHHFQNQPGVIDAVSGYQGGATKDPSYKEVSYTETGHAEVVRVVYDPKRTTYRHLLRAFFAMHDPTQLNRQGPDVGTQYRSAIFAADQEQFEQAGAYIQTLESAGLYKKPIVTQVARADGSPFYPAEGYHQDYVERTGRACHAMRPLSDLPE